MYTLVGYEACQLHPEYARLAVARFQVEAGHQAHSKQCRMPFYMYWTIYGEACNWKVLVHPGLGVLGTTE
jgi:hypothetical protein